MRLIYAFCSIKPKNAKSLFLLINFFCLFKVDIYELLIVPLICQLLFGSRSMMSNKPRDESENNIYNLVMSSSWNFPARASPSCEGSEPSQAELGHFNFRAETELTILTICVSKNCKFLTYFPILLLYHNSNQFQVHISDFM